MTKRIWYINGRPIPSDPEVVLPTILADIPDFQYWSEEALSKLYIGALQMAITLAQEEKKERKGAAATKLTRYINAATGKIKFLPRRQEKWVEFMYMIILTAEGFSTLSGFGMSNRFGDRIIKNPEHQSIKQ